MPTISTNKGHCLFHHSGCLTNPDHLSLYISPVGFSSSVVPDKWRLLYSLNPLVGVIDGFRWAILGGNVRIFWPGFLISNGLVLLSLVTGIWYFRRTEKTFADVI